MDEAYNAFIEEFFLRLPYMNDRQLDQLLEYLRKIVGDEPSEAQG